MEDKSRIASILNADSLDFSDCGFQSFYLSELDVERTVDFDLPENLRLGHLVERIVAELIKSSVNYEVKYKNLQIVDKRKTIGEIDFIVEEKATNKLIHIELAYKFYLFDPGISSEMTDNWIGPNRKDSLSKKIDKLRTKQFPLLYHNSIVARLNQIDIAEVSQALCLLVSLFVPYKYEHQVSPRYKRAVKGYYINMEIFARLDKEDIFYYLPPKKEWGMEPSENESWFDFSGIKKDMYRLLGEKHAPLCWQKHKGSFSQFFIVWW